MRRHPAWNDQGISGKDQALIQEMNGLSRSAQSAERLWALTLDERILIAHCALERLKEFSSIAEADRLHAYIKDRARAEDRRIRALDVLVYWVQRERQELGETKSYCQGVELIKDVFFDPNPYFSKGAVAGLGLAGGKQALRALFQLATSPQGRIVRPELYEESISLAGSGIGDLEQFLDQAKRLNHRLFVYLREYIPQTLERGRFSVYPCNDFLALAVKEQGVNYKRFKYLVEEQ